MILAHWHKLRQTQFTPPDSQAPTVPSSLSVTNISETSLTLNWAASTDNVGVTGYDLRLDGSGSAGTTTNTSFTFTGLTAGTSYDLEVRAKDAAGNTSDYALITQSTASTGITFIASMFQYIDGGGTATLTGIQSGDLVVAVVTGDAGGQSPVASGFTNIANSNSNSVQYRISYGFSTGTSIGYAKSGNDEGIVLAAFRGVDSTNPLDVTPPSLEISSGNVTSITPPSITPTNNNCMIVIGIGIDDNDKSNATISTGFTTASFSHQTNTNTGVFYKKQTTAQQENPSAISWSGGENAVVGTIALRPE